MNGIIIKKQKKTCKHPMSGRPSVSKEDT